MSKGSEGLIIVKGVLCDIGKCTDSDILVPYGVVSIGIKAFYGCKRVKSIALPQTVTDIGIAAFRECVNLESITVYKLGDVEESGSKEASSEEAAASKETKSVTIPDGVKGIGEYTFYGCKKIKVVVIPESVKRIENYAFAACKSLKVAVVPRNTEVWGRAFGSAVKLTRA